MEFDHQSGRSLQVEGAVIYFEAVGDERGQPLLLLHGGLGSIADFRAVLPALRSGLWVIGIDSRGHGRSTLGPGELSYRRLELDVEAVLAHLAVDRPIDVIGFSDGGTVGFRLCASGRVRVRKLAAIGATWEFKADDPLRPVYEGITGDRWRAKFPASYEAYQRHNPEPDFDRLVAAVVRMWIDTGSSGYPAEEVSRIASDVLLMRGDNDPFVSRRGLADLADRVRGAAVACIPFSGHAVLDDQPEVAALILNEFLARP